MILCSGAFDYVHSGHTRYLLAARALDPSALLLVAIAPDSYIRTVKGREPGWNQKCRMQTVAALQGVDGVIAQKETSVADLIRLLRPRWFVKGRDWQAQLPSDVIAACEAVGAQMMFTDTEATHTSEVLID